MIPSINGEYRPLSGSLLLPEKLKIRLAGFDESCIRAFLERTGRKRAADGRSLIRIRRDDRLAPEAYKMRITGADIRILAGGERGVIWALTTIVNQMNGSRIAAGVIADAPRMAYRGMHLDCARHFFSAKEVKRIIEQISLAKMNTLHWHLSDDQAWRIESARFPQLHKTSGSYYTKEEIRDVVRFAAERGVEIVPEIDLPGHTMGILAAYPEHSCSRRSVKPADRGGIYKTILCAGRESTYAFLNELLEEVCGLFPSEYFHIGGDEAPKSEWKSCPDCRRKKEELKLGTWEDLQGYFAGRVADILRRCGKKPVCWNDLLLASDVPRDMGCQYWTVEHVDPVIAFAGQGREWIYSDMFELYFDYPYSMSPVKKVYRTAPHFGRRACGRARQPIGMEACVWTEKICDNDHLEEMIFPRIYALAEITWSGRGRYREFEKRLRGEAVRLREAGIHVMEESRWNPAGRARREEAFAWFRAMRELPQDEEWLSLVEQPESGGEFMYSFVTKFFHITDLPALLAAYRRSRAGGER